LAQALWTYEHLYHFAMRLSRSLVKELRQALKTLQAAAELMLPELRRREIPLEAPTLRHQIPSLIQATHDVVTRWSQIRPADIYRSFGVTSGAPYTATRLRTRALLQDMAHAFRVHGPSTFGQEAIYDALEAILGTLGVHNERGKPLTAAGIKGLLRRMLQP